MTDNTRLNPGQGGDLVAMDDIDGVKHQRVLIEFGSEGQALGVSSGSRLPVEIVAANSPSVDAFGRFRTSQVTTLNDFKQVHGIHNDLIWTTGSTGSGSIAHDSNRSSTILTVHTGSGDERIHQTKKHFRYTPGISFVVSMTGVLGAPKDNVRKRLGYFDLNDGVYWQTSGSEVSLVLRNSISGSVSELIVSQSDWNVDRMDGFGPSGVVLDTSKAQIFVFDFQWLGSGRVRTGVFFNGSLTITHEFRHSNRIGSAYMATPTLPIRWEITNLAETSSPTSTEQMCYAVCAEGQIGRTGGIVRSANRGTSVQSIGTTKIPVISMRMTAENVSANVSSIVTSISSLTAADYLWEALLNPMVTDTATWVSGSNSVVEIDTTRSGSVTGGTVLASGYGVAIGTNQSAVPIEEEIMDQHSALGFHEDLVGKRDELVIAVQQISGGPDNFLATLRWRELT